MGIAASVVSAVLKSVIGDKLGSGLIKELAYISIGGISEKSINDITDFINAKTDIIQEIFSKKNMTSLNISDDNIVYVEAEIKDLFSKIDITDEVFRQCKYDNMNLSAYLWNKYFECKKGNIECESEIKRCLLTVADAIIKLELESENFEKNVIINISNSVDDNKEALQKISMNMIENFDKLDANSQIVINILLKILEQIQEKNIQNNVLNNNTDERAIFKNNKKKDYIKNWNSTLFLHIDKNQRPITLSKAFIMPNYKIHTKISRIGFSHNDTLDKVIEKYINYDKTSNILIMGVPGIGKSTITAWIANEYKNDDRFIILRFRDWNPEKLQKGLLYAICVKLNCKKEDLEEKILILDGFDEIKALDISQELLNRFFNDIKDFYNFKCIITSRPAYVKCEFFQNVLELKEFDIDKVENFCRIITGYGLNKREKIESNLEVLGIPVILYMALMTDTNIGENPSKPELYNKIFAEKGGIFDKFSYDGTEYDIGDQLLRSPENIKKYLGFLKEVAFKMFEAGSSTLMKGKYTVPKLETQDKPISILEFPIKHLFDNTAYTIEFIHNSVYEYFVSEYVYALMYDAIINKSSTNVFNKLMGNLLKNNILTIEILDFLRYKIRTGKLNKEFNVVKESFNNMLNFGMTYFTGKCTNNIIESEMRIFSNMLEIIHLWDHDICEFDASLLKYIRFNNQYTLNLLKVTIKKSSTIFSERINLEGVFLERANLEGANLEGANLERANLKEANLTKTYLKQANLERADLSYKKDSLKNKRGANLFNANLEEANLSSASLIKANLFRSKLKRAILYETDLRGADLRGANLYEVKLGATDFSEADLRGADLRGADLKSADLRGTSLNNAIISENQVGYLKKHYDIQGIKIYISKTKKIIKYENYQKRNF